MKEVAKPSFTPGPWTVSETAGDDSPDTVFTVLDETSPILGVCTIQNYRRGEYYEPLANAHLIAAAPDMYQMLKRLVERHEQYRNREATMHEFECCIDDAVEVLAKAVPNV